MSRPTSPLRGTELSSNPDLYGLGRRDMVALASLAMLAVGIPLLLSVAAGAVGVPGNDDWVYIRAATSLFDSGVVDMGGHTAAFIGQLVLVQPLLWLSGGDPWAFTAFGLLMTAVGAAASYLLARRFVATSSAVLVVLLVVMFPGFVRVSASFMTDVPAYTLAVVSLLLGTRWLQGDGGRLTLVASLVAGIIGVSIREFALAAPVAVLACAWARNRPGDRPLLGIASVLLAAGVVGVRALASSVIGPAGAAPADVERLLRLGPAFATLSAAVLPAIVLLVGRRIATFTPQQVVVGAAIACLVLLYPDGPLLGNLWTSNGVAGNVILNGTRAPVIGELAWAFSCQLAVFAGVLAATLAVVWAQRNAPPAASLSSALSAVTRIAASPEGPLVFFVIAYAGELVAFAPLGNLFDRYLYPLIPVAAILLLRRTSAVGLTRSHALAHGTVAWLAVSALVIAANSFAYDAARHREGNAAVAIGYSAGTIDAGYEWVGYHGTAPPRPGAVLHGWMWYDEFLASSQPCVVVSNSPLTDDAMELIRENPAAYRQYLFFGPAQSLFMYAVVTPECPTPPLTGSAGVP